MNSKLLGLIVLIKIVLSLGVGDLVMTENQELDETMGTQS